MSVEETFSEKMFEDISKGIQPAILKEIKDRPMSVSDVINGAILEGIHFGFFNGVSLRNV